MSLSSKQKAFSLLIAKLILKLDELGYETVLGEAHRPKEMAEIYAQRGIGIKNSLHTLSLALDLNLFKDGQYLQETEQYKEAGEIWESYSTSEFECSWGGRFKDGCHFSIEHYGIR